jgi:hypothetical protein
MKREVVALLDTQRIHEYVFGTTELSQIRGASLLLNECTRERWKRQIAVCGGREIFCGGGNAVARFGSESEALQFCRRAERLLRQKTGTARAAWHIEQQKEENEDFPGRGPSSWRETSNGWTEPAKQAGNEPVWSEANPYARFCDVCGVGDASGSWSKGGSERWLCNSCMAKSRVRRGYWFTRFVEFGKQATGFPSAWDAVSDEPDDLNQLGEYSAPAGYLAFIYLDINEMGRRFREIERQADFKALSEAVENSTREALFRALAETLEPQRAGDKHVAPFEVFLSGGDDAALTVPANRAADFAMAFFRQFDETFPHLHRGSPPKVSLGIVYAHSRFPVRMAIDHAEALMRNAKARAHQDGAEQSHMVDYMVVPNAVERPVRDLRSEQYTGELGRPLVSRPLRLEEFIGIRELCGILKGLPRTKVKALYDLMFGGLHQTTLDYCYWLMRLEQEQRDKMRQYGARKKHLRLSV